LPRPGGLAEEREAAAESRARHAGREAARAQQAAQAAHAVGDVFRAAPGGSACLLQSRADHEA
jgi:hypothetical protein